MDSKMIEKEFDRWWNTFKNQATRQYPVKAAREAWAACAMLMADRVKELEAEKAEFHRVIEFCKDEERRLLQVGDLPEIPEYQTKENLYYLYSGSFRRIKELFNYRIKQPLKQEISDLQTKLDEAVSVIKIIKENVIHYVVTEEEQHLAYNIEKFLESIDKSYLQEKGGGGSNKSGSQYKIKEEAEQFLSSLDKPIKEDR